MKAYLNPQERFANRMKASLGNKEGADDPQVSEDQKALFVDQNNIDLNPKKGK